MIVDEDHFWNEYYGYANRSYNTRLASYRQLKPSVMNISYEGVNLWNNLPDDLKNITPLLIFETYLKSYL